MPPQPRIGIAYHKNLRNTTTDMHWSQGGANERAPADTPRDPKRDRALQRDSAEEIKVCHPGGNTRQSTITDVQEDESRS